MDRNLEIALISSALVIAWGYALRLCLHEGDGRWLPISKQHHPAAFWSVMLVLGMAEAGFIGLALMSFAAWLNS